MVCRIVYTGYIRKMTTDDGQLGSKGMFLSSLLGLIVGLLFYRKSISQGGALAAMVGFVLALVIPLL
jgi:hypothetical protein